MANDFGFRDLSWIKYATKIVSERLDPLREREKNLDKEIRHLRGMVDVKEAEMRNLHLRAVLDARSLGFTKSMIDEAVNKSRISSLPIPPKEKAEEEKPVEGEELKGLFNEALKQLDGAHKTLRDITPGLKKRTSFHALRSALKSDPAINPDARKSNPSLEVDPQEWGNDAMPTPRHGVKPITKEELPYRVIGEMKPTKRAGFFPKIREEKVNKREDDDR